MARRPERKTMGREEGKMGFMEYAYHVLSGQCSGIPDCCVEFFCTEWQGMLSQGIESKHWCPPEFDYIPCPACRKSGNSHQLRICDPEDCCPVGSRKKRAQEFGKRKHLTRKQWRKVIRGPLFASEDLS